MRIFIVCLIVLLCAGCISDILGLKSLKNAPRAVLDAPGGVAAGGANPCLFLKLWNMLWLFIVLQVLIIVLVVHHFDLVLGLLSVAALVLISYAGIRLFHLNYHIADIAICNLLAFYVIWKEYDHWLGKLIKI